MSWFGVPDGAVDRGSARHRANLEMLAHAGALVIGRGAYDDMVQAWPPSESPMGTLMNQLPKVVFSNSLDTVDWENARLNRLPLAEEIAALKTGDDGDVIALGGGHFCHSLICERLVDELRLTVHPVALGDGISLMHGLPEPQRFELVGATTYTDGSVVKVLVPAN